MLLIKWNTCKSCIMYILQLSVNPPPDLMTFRFWNWLDFLNKLGNSTWLFCKEFAVETIITGTRTKTFLGPRHFMEAYTYEDWGLFFLFIKFLHFMFPLFDNLTLTNYFCNFYNSNAFVICLCKHLSYSHLEKLFWKARTLVKLYVD